MKLFDDFVMFYIKNKSSAKVWKIQFLLVIQQNYVDYMKTQILTRYHKNQLYQSLSNVIITLLL